MSHKLLSQDDTQLAAEGCSILAENDEVANKRRCRRFGESMEDSFTFPYLYVNIGLSSVVGTRGSHCQSICRNWSMKTDLTRTGKRTHQGALDDLKKSRLDI